MTLSSRSRLLILTFAVLPFLIPTRAEAWGRRGHALVAETAALLLAERATEKLPDKSFAGQRSIFRDRSFDLGYYANVPDIVWKSSENVKIESPQHYVDLEIYQREVKGMSVQDAFAMTRADFNAKFPGVGEKGGYSFWRIRELMTRLSQIAEQLKKTDLSHDKRFEFQREFLVTAGIMGHYVGDLGMPLHVTENHDGKLTDQKGIHSFYEDAVVDFFPLGDLENQVYKAAKVQKRNFEGKGVLDIVTDLANESAKRVPDLLKADKRVGRASLFRARDVYRKMIVDGMASASVVLAELWSRNLGWNYDGEKFYEFVPSPAFIVPGADQPMK